MGDGCVFWPNSCSKDRDWGKSSPYRNLSTENMKYLNVDQAIENVNVEICKGSSLIVMVVNFKLLRRRRTKTDRTPTWYLGSL